MKKIKKYTEEYIISSVKESVHVLWKNQPNLSKFTSETNEHEPNLSFHFTNEMWKFFPEYDCDFDIIKLNLGNRRPDIIFHKRGNNKNNLLVIEVKRITGIGINKKNMKCNDDIEKIKDHWFSETLNYKYGLSIVLDIEEKKYKGILLTNGTSKKESII